jgi:CRISPR/Cas system CMR-associated protein Cmr5 small subunit
MKNLEQIRAKNALAAARSIGGGKNDGENIAKKVPTMIRENGILGAAAFAAETGKGYESVFNAIIAHLADPHIKKIGAACSLQDFVAWLAGHESVTAARLRAITAETMAYLNYLRRFASKKCGD